MASVNTIIVILFLLNKCLFIKFEVHTYKAVC